MDVFKATHALGSEHTGTMDVTMVSSIMSRKITWASCKHLQLPDFLRACFLFGGGLRTPSRPHNFPFTVFLQELGPQQLPWVHQLGSSATGCGPIFAEWEARCESRRPEGPEMSRSSAFDGLCRIWSSAHMLREAAPTFPCQVQYRSEAQNQSGELKAGDLTFFCSTDIRQILQKAANEQHLCTETPRAVCVLNSALEARAKAQQDSTIMCINFAS